MHDPVAHRRPIPPDYIITTTYAESRGDGQWMIKQQQGAHLELFVEEPAPAPELVSSQDLGLIVGHRIEDVEERVHLELAKVARLQSCGAMPVAVRYLHALLSLTALDRQDSTPNANVQGMGKVAALSQNSASQGFPQCMTPCRASRNAIVETSMQQRRSAA